MEDPALRTKRCQCNCDTYGCPCSRIDISNVGAVIRTLLYRIWLYRKHNICVTILQILIPPLILYGSAEIHASVLPKHKMVQGWTEWPITTETQLYSKICGEYCGKSKDFLVSYYPKGPFTEEIIKAAKTFLIGGGVNVEFEEVQTVQEVTQLAVLHHIYKKEMYIGGIIFDHVNTTLLNPLPGRLKFKIRSATYIPTQIQPFTSFTHELNDPKHYMPFMALELALTRAYMQLIKDNSTVIPFVIDDVTSINIQPFPYLPHDEYLRPDGMPEKSEWIVPTGIVLGLTVIVFSFVRWPVSEKETGFKYGLNLMGLPPSAFWIGWILNQLIVQLIALAIEVYVMFYQDENGVLIAHGSYDLWFFILFLYTLASLSFMCFVSAFFKRSVMATYVGATIWLLTYYFVDVYIPSYVISISHAAKVAVCLIPNGGLLWAMMVLTSYGENWQSLRLSLDDNGVTLTEVMIMFVVDIVLYFQLTMYIDHLRPGPFEAIQPWNYFFDGIRCTWTSSTSKGRRRPSTPSSKIPSIEFMGISKKYHLSNNLAVENVSLKIFPGRITVILGHVGCGKTTLVRMLCGEYFPTLGTASVEGHDIRYYRQKVQLCMSVGFQRNLFCDYITVMEHLLLIGMLKGLSRKEAKNNAKMLLDSFELNGIKDCYIDRLLLHEQRILTVLLALIGNTSVILLDEPTCGLEPEVRKFVWDRIKERCTERTTLVLFTSDMEEAYYLGDRIAIMSRGHIIGCGSSQRLERLFATGYHLQIEINQLADRSVIMDFVKASIETSKPIENQLRRISQAVNAVYSNESISESFFEEDVTEKPKPVVSNISILERQGAFRVDMKPKSIDYDNDGDDSNDTMLLLLPKRESVYFPQLFISLEDEIIKTRLGICSYRIKLYSMEQAFKELDQYMEYIDDNDNSLEALPGMAIMVNSLHSKIPTLPKEKISSEIFLGLHRLQALILKRLLWIKGGWLYLFVQIFAPVFLLIFTIQATNEYYDSSIEPASIHYNIRSMYPYSRTFVRHNEKNVLPKILSTYTTKLEPSIVQDIGSRTFKEVFSLDKRNLKGHMFGRYVIGADFSDTANPIATFSSAAFHAGPLSLMIMLNALLKHTFPNNEYSVDVSSHSIAHPDELLKFFPEKAELMELESSMTFAIILGFSFFVFTSGFVTQPSFERLSHEKRLQLNTGVNSVNYWVSMLLVDFGISIALAICLAILLWHIPTHPTFADIEFATHFVYFWALASYCCILLSYICSFFFRRARTSFYAMLSCNQVLGLFAFVLIKTFAKSVPQQIAKLTLHLLVPFNVPSGLYRLVNLAVRNAQCKLMSPIVLETICVKTLQPKWKALNAKIDRSCCAKSCVKSGNCRSIQPYLDWKGLISSQDVLENLTIEFLFLILHAVFLTLLLYLTEKGITKRLLTKTGTTPSRPKSFKLNNDEVPESVRHESENVDEVLGLKREVQKEYFIVKEITKQTRNRQILTDISFLAEPGKLCCIVGPSGSGKSVLFQVLAKMRKSTDGNVYFDTNCLVSWHHKKFVSEIGYCPSKDFGLNRISGIQVLKLFGRLKGIPNSDLKEHVNFWVKELGVQNEFSGRCEFYSESVRGRLALACCFIGDPPVIILDDPLKYLDPTTHLQFWNIIDHLLSRNRIIIMLTTDLGNVVRRCSKLLFMVNGHLRYVKHPDAMIQEFNIGATATLVIKIKSDPGTPVSFEQYSLLKNRIENDFPNVELQDEKHDALFYLVSNSDCKWSQMFRLVEAIKLDFLTIVQSYEIRETVLEDVYRTFALNQHKYRTSPTTWDQFCLTYC